MPEILSTAQIKVADSIRTSLKKYGINNPTLQNAIIMVVWKESGMVPKNEICYSRKDGVAKVRRIFGARLNKYSDTEVLSLLDNCVKFFDAVYGKDAKWYFKFDTKNDLVGDGYKYRGRGFNGITFKTAYEKYGKSIGIDLVKNPDLLNDPKIAGECLALFYRNALLDQKDYVAKTYGDPNKIKDIDKALLLAFQVNSGWKKIDSIKNDVTGGWQKVQTNKADLLKDLNYKSPFNILPLLAGGIFFLAINPKWIKKYLPINLKK